MINLQDNTGIYVKQTQMYTFGADVLSLVTYNSTQSDTSPLSQIFILWTAQKYKQTTTLFPSYVVASTWNSIPSLSVKQN